MSPINRAVLACGGQKKLADAIGVAPSFVHQWTTGHRPVPARWCAAIEKATSHSVTRYELCPNVFSPPTVAVEGDPAEPAAVITLPTNRHATEGEAYSVSEADLAEYTALYPAVDVAQALRSMRGWLLANPGKRKTLRGMPRFINTWLTREQNQGGAHGPDAQRSAASARRLTAAQQIREKLADCD